MSVLVLYYRWPRIKEGLTHIEHAASPWHLATIPAPAGAWMFAYGKWHRRSHTKGADWLLCDVEQVPKEIRAAALLLT